MGEREQSSQDTNTPDETKKVDFGRKSNPIKPYKPELTDLFDHLSAKCNKSNNVVNNPSQKKTLSQEQRSRSKMNKASIIFEGTVIEFKRFTNPDSEEEIQELGDLHSEELENVIAPELTNVSETQNTIPDTSEKEPNAITLSPFEFVSLHTILSTDPQIKKALDANPEITGEISQLFSLLKKATDSDLPPPEIARTTALQKTVSLLLLDEDELKRHVQNFTQDGKALVTWIANNQSQPLPKFLDDYYRANISRSKNVPPEQKKQLIDDINTLLKKK